jgi:GAF domain-containing protein
VPGFSGTVPTRRVPNSRGTNTQHSTQAGSGERDPQDSAQPDLRLGPVDLAHAHALIDELGRARSLRHCALFLWDPAVGRLRLAAQQWGPGEDLGEVHAGTWTIALSGVCGRAFTTGRPALVPDVEDDPDFLSFPGSRTRSELAVPILCDGRPIGVINLESPRVGAYGPADVEALGTWVDSVGEAIRSFYPGPA